MGYDLHITRRAQWSGGGDDITREEFIAYVKNDSEFSYPGDNGEDSADWKSSKSNCRSWLFWEDGQIYTKNPEPEFVDKIVMIAKALGARAQGDDGEVYLSATEIQKETEEASPPTVPAISFGKLLLWAFLIGCVLLVIKLQISG